MFNRQTRVLSYFFFMCVSCVERCRVHLQAWAAGMFIFPPAHTVGRCLCPPCEDRLVQARIVALMTCMPVAVYMRLVDELIRPYLLSLSGMLPSLFPTEWVCRPPLSLPRVGGRMMYGHLSLRCLFLQMCQCVALSVDGVAARQDSAVDATPLVQTIVLGGEDIYSRLLTRKRMLWRGRVRCRSGYRLWIVRMQAQIESIRGTDVVFQRLRSQIEDLNSFRAVSYTPEGLCKFACNVGMVDRMLHLAERFSDECYLAFAGRRYLGELISMLEHILESERERRLAVAMALHARLGGMSGLGGLGGDLLPLCIPSIMSPPIGTWERPLDEFKRIVLATGPHLSCPRMRLRPGGGAQP